MRRARQLKYHVNHVAALLSTRSPDLAYLGWTGQGNLGDEAIREAQKIVFSKREFTYIPVHNADNILGTVSRIRARSLPTELLLGGGTVIGRPEWLERIEIYQRFRSNVGITIWGAGVEDPEFVGYRTHASKESLNQWTPLLKRAGRIGVRGPRSAELLADNNIDSEVVGDPALILQPSRFGNSQKGHIALNLGGVEDQYHHSGYRPADWNAELVSALDRSGFTIQPFAMAQGDFTTIEAARRQAGISLETPVRIFVSPTQVIDWLTTVDVVVSQRLHGSILAAAASTPFLSLDYRPKCADFAASVHRSEFNVRVDRTSPNECVEMVQFLSENRTRESADQTHRVAELRQRLLSVQV